MNNIEVNIMKILVGALVFGGFDEIYSDYKSIYML
jgi:hypothetical protein